jgi:pilus assembly protein CpaB
MARLPRQAPAALALVAGVFTSALSYAILTARPAPAAPASQPMVVARAALDETHPIAAGDLMVIQVADRPKGAFRDPGELVGRLPLVPVPAGQPVLGSHLASEGTQADLWRRVPAGKRAITLALNEVAGVGGFVRPGLRVDVIGVAREGDHWSSSTVAQDLAVLAVAQDDKRAAEAKAKLASSATLLVSPEQAEAISLAGERGSVRLVLRGPDDHKIMKAAPKPPPALRATSPVKGEGGVPSPARRPTPSPRAGEVAVRPEGAPRPAPKPVEPPAVEIIRGFSPEGSR